MQTLLIVSICVTTIAVLVQAAILVALYASVKKSSARMEALANDVRARALPTLDAAQSMITEYRPRIELILSNLAETSTAVKEQVSTLERPIAEVVERTRIQVARVDDLLSRTLDRVENATELVHHSVSSPVRIATGVLQGVTAGLATLFGRGDYARAKKPAGIPKDDIFI